MAPPRPKSAAGTAGTAGRGGKGSRGGKAGKNKDNDDTDEPVASSSTAPTSSTTPVAPAAGRPTAASVARRRGPAATTAGNNDSPGAGLAAGLGSFRLANVSPTRQPKRTSTKATAAATSSQASSQQLPSNIPRLTPGPQLPAQQPSRQQSQQSTPVGPRRTTVTPFGSPLYTNPGGSSQLQSGGTPQYGGPSHTRGISQSGSIPQSRSTPQLGAIPTLNPMSTPVHFPRSASGLTIGDETPQDIMSPAQIQENHILQKFVKVQEGTQKRLAIGSTVSARPADMSDEDWENEDAETKQRRAYRLIRWHCFLFHSHYYVDDIMKEIYGKKNADGVVVVQADDTEVLSMKKKLQECVKRWKHNWLANLETNIKEVIATNPVTNNMNYDQFRQFLREDFGPDNLISTNTFDSVWAYTNEYISISQSESLGKYYAREIYANMGAKMRWFFGMNRIMGKGKTDANARNELLLLWDLSPVADPFDNVTKEDFQELGTRVRGEMKKKGRVVDDSRLRQDFSAPPPPKKGRGIRYAPGSDPATLPGGPGPSVGGGDGSFDTIDYEEEEYDGDVYGNGNIFAQFRSMD